MKYQRFLLVALLTLFTVFAVQCGASEPAAPAAPAEPAATEEAAAPAEAAATEEAMATTEAETAEEPAAEAPASDYKLAAIFPGVITDADYNTLGYLAVEAVQQDLDVPIAFSESVAVPDVERVMREYIDDGFNIIFTHGSQFVSQTQTLAAEFPDVHFIAESDGAAENPPANLWIIDRNFQVGFYPLAVVAASVFVAGMLVGADSMSRAVGVPTFIADVIVAASLIAVLVATLLTQYRVRRS